MDDLRRRIGAWGSQLWADVKASTDAGVLSALRVVGLLYGPIDEQLPIDQAFKKAMRHRLAPHVGWRHALGGIAYLLFILLVVTGVLLAVHYRPSPQEAYASIRHIVSEVSFGWLVRDLHAWSANLLVLALLAHMARVFFDASYKPPRETTWLIGVFLLFLILAFGATGYLLPWDQWSYWTVTEALDAVQRVPVVGGATVAVLRGDPIVSGGTLSRFFAVHVVVLPWLVFGLILIHFTMVRRHGIAPTRGGPPVAGPGRRFFPNHLLRSLMVAAMVTAIAISAAVLWPRPISEPADPATVPETLRSTWVVVHVSRALIYYTGPFGFAAFSLLGLSLALLPLFDRGPERTLRRRPAVAALGLLFFVGFAVAWIAGRQLRSVPPSLGPTPEEAPTTAGAPLPAVGPDAPRPVQPTDSTATREPGR